MIFLLRTDPKRYLQSIICILHILPPCSICHSEPHVTPDMGLFFYVKDRIYSQLITIIPYRSGNPPHPSPMEDV